MRRALFLLSSLSLALFGVVAACVGTDPDAVNPPDAAVPGQDGSGPGSSGDSAGNPGNDGGQDGNAEAGPTCASPQVACGANCVNPASFAGDNANCGSCGHDCGPGSTCTTNHCSAATILPPGAAPTGHEITSIAVDPNGVYFVVGAGTVGVSHGTIEKCPLAACTAPVVLFDAPSIPDEVDFILTTPGAAGYLYYSDNANDHIFRMLTDGGTEAGAFPGTATVCADNPAHCVVDLQTAGGHPFSLASDGKNIYTFRDSTNGGAGGVMASLPSGATGNDFGEHAPLFDVSGLAIALDPADATSHWLYVAGQKGLFAVDTTTSTSLPTSLLTSGIPPALSGGIAVGNGTVFATTFSGVLSVRACATTSTCAATNSNTFASSPGALAMTSDDKNVIWSATGHIFTCPFTGCADDAATSVASPTSAVRAITNDAKNIYWGDDKGGVYRVAK